MRRLLVLVLLVLLSGAVTAPTVSASHPEDPPRQANIQNDGTNWIGQTFVITGISSLAVEICGHGYREHQRVASPGIGLVDNVSFSIPVIPGDRFVVVDQGACEFGADRLLLTLEPVG